MIYLRSGLYAIVQALLTLIYAPLSLLILPLPFPTRFSIMRTWARLNLAWLRITCGVQARYEGSENIPETPCIIMCKHQSTWETYALQRLFHPQAWVAKRSLLWIPFFGWGLATMRPIAIDRGAGRRAVQQIVDQGRARLRDRIWVVIFPEGTRIKAGEAGRYKLGGAILAAETGYPVVPVAHNAGYLWPRNSFLKYPGRITLRVGKPIPSAGRRAEDIINDVRDAVEGMVDDMGVPGGPSTD